MYQNWLSSPLAFSEMGNRDLLNSKNQANQENANNLQNVFDKETTYQKSQQKEFQQYPNPEHRLFHTIFHQLKVTLLSPYYQVK